MRAAQRPRVVELHIRHMPGGKFTDHVFGAMKEKEILRIEGPFGSFFLREDSRQADGAAGLGHRLRADQGLIEHMQAKNSTRPATLYWGGRRPGDLYMDAWVKERLAEMPNLRYVPVISNALPEDNWTGRTGFVHQAVLDDLPDLVGLPGVCLRRAHRGRVGARRVHGEAGRARPGRILRRPDPPDRPLCRRRADRRDRARAGRTREGLAGHGDHREPARAAAATSAPTPWPRRRPTALTIGISAVATHAINPWLFKKMPYDPIKDFAPITQMVRVPNVLVMNADTARA
jgi:hypothetical protein